MVSEKRIQIDNVSVFIRSVEPGDAEDKPILLCIHGFSGSSEDWLTLMNEMAQECTVAAPDLPGFGKSDIPDNPGYYNERFLINVLDTLINSFSGRKPFLLGYSMGGRLTLAYAAAHPQKIAGILLESASPGIESESERSKRRRNDARLAAYIEEHGVEAFTDKWLDLPLFTSLRKLPGKQLRLYRKQKLKNSAEGLARSLRGFGTGSMTPLWPALDSLSIPALIISGALDDKFTAIGNIMMNRMPSAIHKVVDESGHIIHLEKDKEFINLVSHFISDYQ